MKARKIHRGIARIEKQTREIGRLAAERDERVEAMASTAVRHLIGADLTEKARGRESRSARNNRVWKLGNLVRITGLLDLDKDVLLGALRGAAPYASHRRWAARWRFDGQRILAVSGASGDTSRGPELPCPGKDVDPKAARKALNHRIMTAGGILEQAGMGCRSPAMLLGILAAIARRRGDTERVARWKAAAAVDTGNPIDVHPHVEVRFPEPIARELGRELADLGITFDREKLFWMGFADPISTRRAAQKGDGEVRVRVKNKTKTRRKSSRKKSSDRGNAGRGRSHLATGPTAARERRRKVN